MQSWSVHSETQISHIDVHDEHNGDKDVTGNVEPALNIKAAESWITALHAVEDE